MDVFTRSGSTPCISIEQAVCCDICGYPRIGLPETARCPECGENPPEIVGGRTHRMALTRGKRRWLRQTSLGLILLLLSYIASLRIILVMNLGPQILAAVNVPAPKVAASALILRSVGNRPGPWGVSGTLAVLASALAVWLLTDPRNERGEDTGLLSLRGATRWSAVICTGGVLGLMLCQSHLSAWGGRSFSPLLAVIVLGCELPVNTLLYLRLRGIARIVGERGAASTFGLCAAGMLIAGVGTVCILFLPDDDAAWSLNAVGMVYGAGVMVVGMAATAAVVRLMAASTSAGFADLAGEGRRAIVQVLVGIRALLHRMRADPVRWSMAWGILLWLGVQPWLIGDALMMGPRSRWGGDVPYINALAPKAAIAPALLPREADSGTYYSLYEYYQTRGGFLLLVAQLIAFWLMTRQPPGRWDWRCAIVRWGPIVAAGLSMGWLFQLGRGPVSTLKVSMVIFLSELPVTMALYWYLGSRADHYGYQPLGRVLRRIGGVVGAVIVLPAFFLVLTWYPGWRHEIPTVMLLAGIYIALSLGSGLLAFAALLRLAFALTTGRREEDAGLSSPAHDSGLAHSTT